LQWREWSSRWRENVEKDTKLRESLDSLKFKPRNPSAAAAKAANWVHIAKFGMYPRAQ
jgi:hypothetical protein